MGLSTVVINTDTVNAARTNKLDLWASARTSKSIIILAPGQLSSDGFASLVKDPTFAARLCVFNVDETHLICSWSGFRPSFLDIGKVRARLPGSPVLIALTATLLPGTQITSVCYFLGMHQHNYHLIRRSNARYDIQWIFRTMVSGEKSLRFPELDWVLEGEHTTLIFCGSIALTHRITTYLVARAMDFVDCEERVRELTSLSWDSYVLKTLELLRDDRDVRARVTVGTDTMSVGLDASAVDTVVSFGHIPNDINLMVQRPGRIRDGRDRVARSIVYLPRNAREQANKAIASTASRTRYRLRARDLNKHVFVCLLDDKTSTVQCLKRSRLYLRWI